MIERLEAIGASALLAPQAVLRKWFALEKRFDSHSSA
jgi:hypothetical protein